MKRVRSVWRLLSSIGLLALLVAIGFGASLRNRVADTHAGAAPSLASPLASPTITLPPDVQIALDALSAGTIIVACSPSYAVLPEGVTPLVSLGFARLHPGFRYLPHGYCADNPTATPMPLVIPSADEPAREPSPSP